MFGVTGAIVGSLQKKVTITVKLTTSNINEPFVELPIISIPTSPKKPVYNHCLDIANKIYGQFRKIINNKPETGCHSGPMPFPDIAGQLIKLKGLLDAGVLDKDEFERAKKKLLD